MSDRHDTATRVRIFCAGPGFTEGPVITQDGRLAFVSISEGRVYTATEAGELQKPFVTGGGPNGLVEGSDGRLYVAQNGGKPPAKRERGITGGVQVISRDGKVEYLTQDLVSPNDLCFGPDGLLYVTDPTRVPARDDGRIWRCDPETGEAEILASVHWYPNGIAFSLEDDALYVADSGGARIMRFALVSDRLGTVEEFARLPHNLPDGFAFDVEGNLLVAAPDPDGRGDLQVFDREGKFLERVDLGESAYYTNCALGADRRLFVTDSSKGAVLVIDDWPTAGMALHPFRSG